MRALAKGMNAFASNLKLWRGARRYSQLELANRANVSARHLAFLETGRANPSREMIARLGDALDLPLSARNQLLIHAGFAARYPSTSWDAEDMAPVRAAVDYMLERHAPYPAFALDRSWQILRMNAPSERLFGALGAACGTSLIELMQQTATQAAIENWPEVAHHLAQRLRTESAASGTIPEFEAAASEFLRAPLPKGPPGGPVVPLILKAGSVRLSLFSTIAQFGTPEDLTLDDLKIEMFFPADPMTDSLLKAWEPEG